MGKNIGEISFLGFLYEKQINNLPSILSIRLYRAPVYGNESLPAFNSDKMKMLDINNQGRKVMNNYRNDMLEFWAYIEDQVRDISEI